MFTIVCVGWPRTNSPRLPVRTKTLVRLPRQVLEESSEEEPPAAVDVDESLPAAAPPSADRLSKCVIDFDSPFAST